MLKLILAKLRSRYLLLLVGAKLSFSLCTITMSTLSLALNKVTCKLTTFTYLYHVWIVNVNYDGLGDGDAGLPTPDEDPL